jgi:hypothetical protein
MSAHAPRSGANSQSAVIEYALWTPLDQTPVPTVADTGTRRFPDLSAALNTAGKKLPPNRL